LLSRLSLEVALREYFFFGTPKGKPVLLLPGRSISFSISFWPEHFFFAPSDPFALSTFLNAGIEYGSPIASSFVFFFRAISGRYAVFPERVGLPFASSSDTETTVRREFFELLHARPVL